MRILLAADHRGFALKERIKQSLITNHQSLTAILDCGPNSLNPEDDYVDYGNKAISQLMDGDIAILLCGSGHGMDIVANRHPNIRAILGFNLDVIKQGRAHEDANVLIIPADWTKPENIIEYVTAFINTPFSGEDRHRRRLHKLSSLLTNS